MPYPSECDSSECDSQRDTSQDGVHTDPSENSPLPKDDPIAALAAEVADLKKYVLKLTKLAETDRINQMKIENMAQDIERLQAEISASVWIDPLGARTSPLSGSIHWGIIKRS